MMDFHCHLDLYPNARNVYAEAKARMELVWLVTTSPRAYEATSKVLVQASNIVVSPGLHPEIAHQKVGELQILLAQMERSMAVGEIGLDGSARYREHFSLQTHIFSSVVERSQSLGGKVLSIHSRAAAREVLDTLERFPGFGTAVLHWFTDSSAQLRRASDMGCWFSVGPAMLASANGRKLAAVLPRDRVVPESDGPFAQSAGNSIMPWEASSIGALLAPLWRMAPAEVVASLETNGRTLREKLTN